ncbi:hypothetical protein N9751_00890 [Alphaproteobacteria bacterium]|nr:hypothetical protein [Alphaproteobacteria bacterium]
MKRFINVYSQKFFLRNPLNNKHVFLELLNFFFNIFENPEHLILELNSDKIVSLRILSKSNINLKYFEKQIVSGISYLFTKGDIIIRTGGYEYTYKISNFLRLKDESNQLEVIKMKSNIGSSEIEIQDLHRKDISNWNLINEEDISYFTILGNKSNRIKKINLRHTGQDRVIHSINRFKLWTENINGLSRDERIHKKINFNNNENIEINFSLSFEKDKTNYISINDGSFFYKGRHNLEKKISGLIKGLLPFRLQNYFKFFVEILIDHTSLTNNYHFITFNEEQIIKILETVRDAVKNDFGSFIVTTQNKFIDQEDTDLNRRIQRSKSRQKVFFKKNSVTHDILYIPSNEQELVLMVCILSAKNLFFSKFDFIDYYTSKGIDAIADIKLQEGHPTSTSAIVEFKLDLENFIDGRHPINLVEYVIAWKVNSRKFKNSNLNLKKTKLRGLYTLVNDQGHSTKALVISEIDGIIFKWQLG